MSNNINRLIGCLTLMMAFATGTYAQQLKGHVYASDNEPVADAVITSPGCKTVRSAEDGTFVMEGVAKGNPLTVWHDGFFQKVVYVNEPAAADLKIYMVEENKSRYNETMLTPFDTKQGAQAVSGMPNVNRKDFAKGSLSIDNALKGEVAGLHVVNKSGMTG